MKFILLLTFATPVFAGGDHHNDTVYVEQAIQTEVNRTHGSALGIASAQHQFSAATNAWQWSVGMGRYDASDAASVGIGKRFDNLLINFSVGREDGHTGGGVGISGKF